MNLNYQQIISDQPNRDLDEEIINPVIELMEESGPLNISKKQPNIARTLDGICAFSPEDTISFRFEDSYQYVSSRNIIAISKKIDYAWFNSDNKKTENDKRQDLREIL